jgi:hypothetical protein
VPNISVRRIRIAIALIAAFDFTFVFMDAFLPLFAVDAGRSQPAY